MIREKYKEMFPEIVKMHGVDSQIEMIIEECSELIHALQKLKRAKKGDKNCVSIAEATRNVCGELADVKIMMCQSESIFDNSVVNDMIEKKLERMPSILKNKM